VLYQLSYISPKSNPCYREAAATSTIRNAKKPSNSNTTERTLPGSIVFTAKAARITSSPSAIHLRPADLGPISVRTGPVPPLRCAPVGMTIFPSQRSNPWCTGEDSNLRSSKERQIYSLLPLTARPPVHKRRPGPNMLPTCQKKSPRNQRSSTRPHSADVSRAASPKEIYRQCGMIAAGLPLPVPAKRNSGAGEGT
jgi:hypothetical protein